ncbi:hypothetical protein GCM10023210_31410 [Chryseobacterium ginsengisoli]|uniref:Baseplate structural protein Gp10 C-terminal domain-containing protein n=1 Tax=Chryseobacterium ginsengisoli TaxID=363853 RepID=A0ABP9MNY3_9FLAO
MRINIKWLQTGGVPLTNDVMAVVMESIETYNVLGDLAGHLTILSGCVITGQNVSPGVVAINGDVLYFEGGNIYTNVYVHTEEIVKTFQDTTDKVLVEKKVVKFGDSSTQYLWSEFFRLETLKSLQIKVNNSVSITDFNALKDEVEVLKIKTAPIINGGIVWAWFKPVDEIPDGWKEAIDIRGKTIVGLDPNDIDPANFSFATLKGTLGEKRHKLTVSELPSHAHGTTSGREKVGTGNQNGASANGGGGSNFNNPSVGGDQPHNNIQPSIIAYFIEPNFQ